MKLVTIEYKTGGGQISIKVSASIQEVLEQTDRQIRSQRRQDRRHIDFRPPTDEFVESLSFATCEDTADLYEKMERNDRIYTAIEKLSELQKRRLHLYYFRGLTYREIAALEDVNQASIGHSLRLALKKLHKLLAER